ncbi:MAG: glycosyltransferase family 4 protein [Solirubrobacteraceae bacterium]
MPTRVGLNLIYLVPGETGGMEVYARELIPALVEAAAGRVELVAFVNREAASAPGGPWGELIPAVTVPVRARSRVQWVLGEQVLLPVLARRAGVELVHSLASTAPVLGGFRRVVTIHDLIYRVYPEAHAGVLNLGMGVLVGLAARRAHRVIADSANTRADLVRYLGVPPGQVDAIPLGVGASAHPASESKDEIRARYALGDRPIVLSASAKRPHKNLRRLLDALSLIPAGSRPVLVLPGYPTWHEAELRAHAASLGVEEDVRFLGWIPAGELEGLYAAARVFVFPSLYEGFGLPVLEAMRRGLPVACSDRSSLPEVAGEAALLFDPERPGEIAAAISLLLEDPAEAARRREAGLAQAARFTWEATAQATLRSYEQALGRGLG